MATQLINGKALNLANLPMIIRELAIEAIKEEADEQLSVILFDKHAEEIYDKYGGYNIDQTLEYLEKRWKDHPMIDELSGSNEGAF